MAMIEGAVTEAIKSNLGDITQQVLARIFDIAKAPAKQPEMLWIIVPVTFSMLLMTFYFGKYKGEELGWNTAFGNSIILFFACVGLLRFLYTNSILAMNVPTMLVIAVLLEGIVLTLLNFLHALPKAFAFGISSGMTINIIVLFLIILVYSQLPLDQITAIAVILVSALVIGILKIIQLLQWGEDEESELTTS